MAASSRLLATGYSLNTAAPSKPFDAQSTSNVEWPNGTPQCRSRDVRRFGSVFTWATSSQPTRMCSATPSMSPPDCRRWPSRARSSCPTGSMSMYATRWPCRSAISAGGRSRTSTGRFISFRWTFRRQPTKPVDLPSNAPPSLGTGFWLAPRFWPRLPSQPAGSWCFRSTGAGRAGLPRARRIAGLSPNATSRSRCSYSPTRAERRDRTISPTASPKTSPTHWADSKTSPSSPMARCCPTKASRSHRRTSAAPSMLGSWSAAACARWAIAFASPSS